jgi:hypothetical protein
MVVLCDSGEATMCAIIVPRAGDHIPLSVTRTPNRFKACILQHVDVTFSRTLLQHARRELSDLCCSALFHPAPPAKDHTSNGHQRTQKTQ